MPKLHFVKKARKANPVANKGESYYWWKHAFGSKQYSKTEPRRSQLTQSDFLAQIWDIEDDLPDKMTEEDADVLREQLEQLREQCEERLEAMPEQFHGISEAAITLEERISALEDWAGEIENIDWEETSPEEAAELIGSSNPGVW